MMTTVKKFLKLYLALLVLGQVVYWILRMDVSPVAQDISLFFMLCYTGYVTMESLDYLKDKIKGALRGQV